MRIFSPSIPSNYLRMYSSEAYITFVPSFSNLNGWGTSGSIADLKRLWFSSSLMKFIGFQIKLDIKEIGAFQIDLDSDLKTVQFE